MAAVSPVSGRDLRLLCICTMVEKKQIKGLYVITDVTIRPGLTHEKVARDAVAGGARVIQLRDKTACSLCLYQYSIILRRLTADAGCVFIVNDRVDIALASGADGVHLGDDDIPLNVAREMMGPKAIVGKSVDSLCEAEVAQSAGADYVGFGPIFATNTKLDAGNTRSVAALEELCKRTEVPVVAIGGIDETNIDSIVEAGADAAAVISSVVSHEDMTAASAGLAQAFERRKTN